MITNRFSNKNLVEAMILLTAPFLLNACATDPNTCDPRQPGFITGLSAMASGCYDKRVAAKEDEASAGHELTNQLNTENRSLVAEKKLTSAQKSQAQRKLSALQRKNADLERKVRNMKADTSTSQSEKSRLQQQLLQTKVDTAKLQQKIQSGNITEKELNRQHQELQKESEEDASNIASSLLVQ